MVLNNVYSQPSASSESQQRTENTILDPQLFESGDVKPTYAKGWLYLLKNIGIKLTCTVQTYVIHG